MIPLLRRDESTPIFGGDVCHIRNENGVQVVYYLPEFDDAYKLVKIPA
jgi:hypothetical protein